ncbi:lysostaphin resistance A-like protein [Flavobacterium sp.]|uniref:CPBP family intramembrane glutamic endopeptidase n=1 Tax=Flavobacterium sp. TaxID=239 RepID=UPI003BC598AA
MFIEQGIKKSNEFWKYILGSILIIIASTLGQLPLGVVVAFKSFKSGKTLSNTNDAINLLDSNLSLFLIMLSFVFGFFGLVLVVKYFHKQNLLDITTSRNKVDWKRVFFSFNLWAIFIVVSTFATYYFSLGELVWNFKPIPFAILFVIATLLIPFQTSVEEYVFRGYLMQGFANLAKNKWFPLVMTSLIFGSMHILNPEVDKMGYIVLVYYIGTGLFLGILTLMDEGMELSLGFHAANNLITALLVTSDWTALRTNSIFKDTSKPGGLMEIFIPVLVIYPILLFIFSKKYQWKNWKEKLTGKIVEENNIITESHV